MSRFQNLKHNRALAWETASERQIRDCRVAERLATYVFYRDVGARYFCA